MRKKSLGAIAALYPMPITLVGANVNGKPNYLVVASCGIIQHDPAMIAVSLNRRHYTNPGIKENGAFSVNVPPADMADLVDYCGIVSGRMTDKAALFTTFYGELGTAPLIHECPVNVECRLVQTLDLPGVNEVFIGEIVQVYASDTCLQGGVPNLRKMDPLFFSIHENSYYRAGERIGHAWEIGRELPCPPRD
jgi:flavin reductase (DIM6/NTAB) family NADH-FMN oxidoreductase RutF